MHAPNLWCSWANTVGPIAPSDMYLHTRRLCKIHHNCLAAPPAPSCYVQIYQNTIFMASFHGAETEENVKGIHIFHPQCSLWVVHSASETMQTMYNKENIVYLVTIWAPVSFSGGTYQRGLLLTAALRAWPPSSVHHYYVTMLCTAVSQPHMGTLKCPVLQCFAQLNQTQVWVWIQTAV